MSRSRIQLASAWVLKTTAYRDTSLLIEAFSRDHGRIALIARGARGGKARSREQLQCFRPLLLSWLEAGDLGTLTGVESDGPAISLSGESVFSGWYLNELLLRLLQRHDPHPQIFNSYSEALHGLADLGEPSLRYFELALLADIGFGIDLPAELHPGQHYQHIPGEPLQPVAQGQRDAYCGSSLIALRDQTLNSVQALRDARDLLRACLTAHLGGKALASATVLRALRQQQRRSS